MIISVRINDQNFFSVECTFEETDPPMCGWINDKADTFDWSIGQGSTATLNTGPENDHTYNDKNGNKKF